MNDRGVKKAIGFSMREFEGAVGEFIAGQRTHPESKEVYAKVDEMLESIWGVGYALDVGVLYDLEEKENPLYHHYEKLKIAFGLLKSKPGEINRMLKKL